MYVLNAALVLTFISTCKFTQMFVIFLINGLTYVRCKLCNFLHLSATLWTTKFSKVDFELLIFLKLMKISNIVTCFDVVFNWPVSLGSIHFCIVIESSKIADRPTSTPTLLNLLRCTYVFVWMIFVIVNIFFWCAIFLLLLIVQCIVWQILFFCKIRG